MGNRIVGVEGLALGEKNESTFFFTEVFNRFKTAEKVPPLGVLETFDNAGAPNLSRLTFGGTQPPWIMDKEAQEYQANYSRKLRVKGIPKKLVYTFPVDWRYKSVDLVFKDLIFSP